MRGFLTSFVVAGSTTGVLLARRVRVSVLSVGYNMTLALFGGIAPVVATYLISRTGDDFSPAYDMMALCMMALCALSLLAMLTVRETAHRPLAR
ncbi:MAG: hypothetical protein AcusKO_18340 [Acuticoccus sp.]